MRKGLLFLVYCFILFLAKAQDWALPSSSWLCTTYDWQLQTVHYTMKVEKDTTLLGIPCKKLRRYDGYSLYTDVTYTYLANDTVFFHLYGAFRPTYYFNAHVGDTISYFDSPNTHWCADSIVKARIFAIDTILVSGQELRSFHSVVFPNPGGNGHAYPDTLVYTEKIGCHYIYPIFTHSCVSDETLDNICDYGDSTIAGFYAGLNQGCLTGIKKIEAANELLHIIPNPATSTVNLSYV